MRWVEFGCGKETKKVGITGCCRTWLFWWLLTCIMASLLAPFLMKKRSINPSPRRECGAMGMSWAMCEACSEKIIGRDARGLWELLLCWRVGDTFTEYSLPQQQLFCQPFAQTHVLMRLRHKQNP